MRRAALALSAALGATLLPFIPGAPSSVSAAPSDPISVIVDGTGFGHGRGMSQWGAYGWAVDQNKSWQWILDHYYGGTTLSDVNTAQRDIRVRLLGLDNLTTVGVTAGSGNVTGAGITARSIYATETSPNRFAIYSATTMACPTSTGLTVPNGPIVRGSTNSTAVRQIQTFLNAFRISGDVTLVVDGAFGPNTENRIRDWQGDQGLGIDGRWESTEATRARQLISGASTSTAWTFRGTVTGPVAFTSPNGENSAAAPASVLGVCDSGGRVTHYRGAIEVRSESDGNRVVNEVKTEDYLRGVVPKEISASWADAGGGKGANAVRAQAVAARSYGLQQSRYGYASICDSQSCQVYFGSASRSSAAASAVNVEDARTDAAIAATAGKVRTWPDGTVVSTEFSASNGPRTAGGAFPPRDDTLGDGTSRNPNHRWTRVLDADSLAARYGLGRLTSATMVDAASGSVNRQFDGIWFNDVVLTGSNGRSVRIPAWDFRGANGLPSPGFTIRTVTRDTTAKSVAFIGDSVGNSIATASTSELRTLTDGTFSTLRIDAVVGRCTTNTSCPGSTGVAAATALPVGMDLVVVELGYNDSASTFAASIDAMMSALRARGARQVLWVNMADIRTSNGSSVYGPANAALQAARGRWSNLTVADWNQASTGPERPRWFSDGVHLTTTGQAQFAVWLRQQMLQLAPSHWLAPPKIIRLPVVGRELVGTDGVKRAIPADAAAVAINVTSVDAIERGFATIWPCEVAMPTASNLNFPGGSRVANGVIAPVGASGEICLYSHAGSDLVVDVTGWFPGGATPSFVGAVPQRLVDSRDGTGGRRGQVTPATPLRIQVAGTRVTLAAGNGAGVVPANASAVALSVVAVDPVNRGFLTLWPCDAPRPVASNLNFVPAARTANNVVVPMAADGTVCLYTHANADIVVDIAGWFVSSAAGGIVAGVPTRLIDTRDGTGGRRGVVTPATPLSVPIRGARIPVNGTVRSIPADAVAAALNLTIVDSARSAFATVWPCGSPRPNASNVNFTPGRRVANGVIASIGTNGSVCVYVHSDAHVVVDVVGWFGGSSPGFVAAQPERFVDTRVQLGPAPR